jgi:hypothetical protein
MTQTVRFPKLPYDNWLWQVDDDIASTKVTYTPRLYVRLAKEVTHIYTESVQWLSGRRDPSARDHQVVLGHVGPEGRNRIVRDPALNGWDTYETRVFSLETIYTVRGVMPYPELIEIATQEALLAVDRIEMELACTQGSRAQYAALKGNFR